MNNELQVFTYEGAEVRTLLRDGAPWWVLKDVCQILGIANHKMTAQRLEQDEVSQTDLTDSLGRKQKATVINEPGLYSVILRSDKPQAKAFKRWVTHDVLPAIRRTGGYTAPATPMTDYQRVMTDTRQQNASIRKAQLLNKIAAQYDGPYRQVLQAHATKELTGEFLLPLPRLEDKTLSAAEVGALLGISANKVGILTNRHQLKTGQYGAWFADTAPGHKKQVQTFRYYEAVVPVLRQLLKAERGVQA